MFSEFFSESCWGKAMLAYKKPQQWTKEESEWLREEGEKIKFIDLRFEQGHVAGSRKERRKQDVP